MLAFMLSVKLIAHEGRIGIFLANLADSKPSNEPTFTKRPHFHGSPGENGVKNRPVEVKSMFSGSRAAKSGLATHPPGSRAVRPGTPEGRV
jgi:hypothetical protein